MSQTFDLRRVWKMQKELDVAILTKHNRTLDNTFFERVVAFLVELGEFVNEARDFKYWSQKTISPLPVLLEEFADGLHFLASQAVYLGAKSVYVVNPSKKNRLQLIIMIFHLAAQPTTFKQVSTLEKLFVYYLQLALAYGFTPTDVESHYIKKNKVNYARLQSSY